MTVGGGIRQMKQKEERMKLTGEKSYLIAPAFMAAAAVAFLLTWFVMEPGALRAAFDNDGRSPFELATIPFYLVIAPLVWWKCPFSGPKWRRILLCSAVSCVALMAVVKELDLHLAAMNAIYPDVVANFKGTPFKMRFLTNADVPAGAKLLALAYFTLFFGVFGVTLAYFFPRFLKGVFDLNPAAWSVGCLGASGVIVQVFDRLPAWYRHAADMKKGDMVETPFGALCTAFEEGFEMVLAVCAILAILQGWAIRMKRRRELEEEDA